MGWSDVNINIVGWSDVNIKTHQGKLHNEVVSISHAGGCFYLGGRHIFTPVLDVLCDGGAEENGFLTHDPDVFSQPAQIELADVLAINENLKRISNRNLLNCSLIVNSTQYRRYLHLPSLMVGNKDKAP